MQYLQKKTPHNSSFYSIQWEEIPEIIKQNKFLEKLKNHFSAVSLCYFNIQMKIITLLEGKQLPCTTLYHSGTAPHTLCTVAEVSG